MTDKMLENSQAEMLVNTDDDNRRKELYKAAYNGDPEKVRVLVKNIACTYDKSMLLFKAIGSRDAETVCTVLQLGADPNSLNYYGETALFFAASHCLPKAVKLLLEYGAKHTCTDKYGQTPVWVAAQRGMVEIVQMLVLAGADPHTADFRGKSPFWIAAARGNEATARFLMEHCGADPNTSNMYGETPLHYAAGHGEVEIVRMLVLKFGADPNTRNIRGESAVAAAFCSTDTVRVLVKECGADPDTADNKGQTPIMLAAAYGCTDMVRVLVEAGVDPDKPDGDGVTPLLHAVKNAHESLVWWFAREWGVDLTKKQPRLAFAMGHHQRLGAASAVSSLSPDVVDLILNYVRAPWAPENKDLSYYNNLTRNSLPLYEWLVSIEDAPPVYAEHNAGLRGSFQCSMCNHTTDQAVALVPCAHRVCRRCWEPFQLSPFARDFLPSCPICQAVVQHALPQEQFPDQARLLM